MGGLRLAFYLFSAYFAVLHDPSGRDIFVNAEQIDYIMPADRMFDGPNAGSRLMVYGIWVAVKEKPGEVIEAVKAAKDHITAEK